MKNNFLSSFIAFLCVTFMPFISADASAPEPKIEVFFDIEYINEKPTVSTYVEIRENSYIEQLGMMSNFKWGISQSSKRVVNQGDKYCPYVVGDEFVSLPSFSVVEEQSGVFVVVTKVWLEDIDTGYVKNIGTFKRWFESTNEGVFQITKSEYFERRVGIEMPRKEESLEDGDLPGEPKYPIQMGVTLPESCGASAICMTIGK